MKNTINCAAQIFCITLLFFSARIEASAQNFDVTSVTFPGWQLNAIKEVSGGYIVAGSLSVTSNDVTRTDGLIICYNTDGTQIWSTQLSTPDGHSTILNAIHILSDGSVLAVGSRTHGTIGDPRAGLPSDGLYILINGAGELQWEQTHRADHFGSFSSIQRLDDNSFLLSGRTFCERACSINTMLLFLDATLQPEANFVLPFVPPAFNASNNDDQQVLFGADPGDCCIAVASVDATNQLRFEPTLSIFLRLGDIVQLPDSSYVAVGQSVRNALDPAEQGWIIAKFDLSGSILWEKAIGTSDLVRGNPIAVKLTNEGSVLVLVVRLFESSEVQLHTFDQEGAELDVETLSIPEIQSITTFELLSNNVLALMGQNGSGSVLQFWGDASLLPLEPETPVNELAEKPVLFPHPAGDLATLIIPTAQPTDVNIRAFDLIGKEVLNFNTSVDNFYQRTLLDLSHLTPGMYVLNISMNQQESDLIFIKQ